MSRLFEELDWQRTDLGDFTLRRRHEPVADTTVYEVKLNDEFLMSSLFTTAEIALADIALAEIAPSASARQDLEVIVGGLGLGYTARAALADRRVSRLTVVETAAPVIDWHRRELFPDTAGLATDPRCELRQADFFELARSAPAVRYDAILLDIDHTPQHVLNPSHRDFYTTEGLVAMTRHLVEDGVFTLWSDDPPDPDFESTLAQVFEHSTAHVINFANPITGGESSNTVYLGRRPQPR